MKLLLSVLRMEQIPSKLLVTHPPNGLKSVKTRIMSRHIIFCFVLYFVQNLINLRYMFYSCNDITNKKKGVVGIFITDSLPYKIRRDLAFKYPANKFGSPEFSSVYLLLKIYTQIYCPKIYCPKIPTLCYLLAISVLIVNNGGQVGTPMLIVNNGGQVGTPMLIVNNGGQVGTPMLFVNNGDQVGTPTRKELH